MPPPTSNVVLTGNPNCGKTTVFNALTGLRAKVGNYAGVTVERKEGRLRHAGEREVTLLDLPGTYSLSPRSLDEQVARDVLLHHLADDVPTPQLVIIVVDASNLERNLFYATQVIELGYPALLVLNMMDVAAELGRTVDHAALSRALGVPVVPLVASKGEGMPQLRQAILDGLDQPAPAAPKSFGTLPAPFAKELAAVEAALQSHPPVRSTTHSESLLILSDESFLPANVQYYPAALTAAVAAARQRLDTAGINWRTAAIEARYLRIGDVSHTVVSEATDSGPTWSDRLDSILTHKIWGLVIFVALMALMFQSIFTFAEYPMTWLEQAVGWLGNQAEGALPAGELTDLLVRGVIGGVGAVVVFLPQICMLFLFISLLEDTGYMSRAAFLMDRLMSKVGLHGKSFIPMLSSFACAIPGIMATRTIESAKDRLATILIAPLMSCSARLPVYTVLIAACLPDEKLGGIIGVRGLAMLGMYLLGTVAAMGMAWVFKKTLLKGQTPMLIMELPSYKRPVLSVTLRHMWDRSKLFLRRAGTVILGINILLWFLATHPKSAELTSDFAAKRTAIAQTTPDGVTDTDAIEKYRNDRLAELASDEQGAQLRDSYAGVLGRFIEPVIAPLGFDWKIGIGIVASFAAREVFVSTMSVVYNVGQTDTGDEAVTTGLVRVLQAQRRADQVTPVYTPRTAFALMVFYVFALQCVSTVVIVWRETGTWRWPLFQWMYMAVLAWVMAFAASHLARVLGWPD